MKTTIIKQCNTLYISCMTWLPSTLIKKIHSGEVLPLASEALYRISLKPCRKVDPGPSPLVCEIFADPELCKAVGFDHVTTAVYLWRCLLYWGSLKFQVFLSLEDDKTNFHLQEIRHIYPYCLRVRCDHYEKYKIQILLM